MLSLVDRTKVKTPKSFLFTEGSFKVDYYQNFEDGKIISQVVRISEDCDQSSDRVSKNNLICHICIR